MHEAGRIVKSKMVLAMKKNQKFSKWGEKFEKSLTKRLTNCYRGGGRLVDDINFGGEE